MVNMESAPGRRRTRTDRKKNAFNSFAANQIEIYSTLAVLFAESHGVLSTLHH